jgi:hypothetical protein
MHASFWEEIDRSRALTEEQRARDTLELIEMTREMNLAGIRMQFPDATDEDVRRIFRERRHIIRQLDERQ